TLAFRHDVVRSAAEHVRVGSAIDVATLRRLEKRRLACLAARVACPIFGWLRVQAGHGRLLVWTRQKDAAAAGFVQLQPKHKLRGKSASGQRPAFPGVDPTYGSYRRDREQARGWPRPV